MAKTEKPSGVKDSELDEKMDDSGEQIKGVMNKVTPESDPKGINSEGGVTTNEEGDEPGSPLEVFEREHSPDEIAKAAENGKLPK